MGRSTIWMDASSIGPLARTLMGTMHHSEHSEHSERRDHGGGIEGDQDPMYWLMPIGLIVGAMVVVAFELAVGGFSFQKRREKFVALTQKAELGHEVDPNVEEKLLRNIDGLANAGDFWTGGAVRRLGAL